MTTATKTKQTAAEAYETAVMEVLGICEDLADDIRDNWPAPETDGIHFGHVGSMNEIAARLRELLAFVRCEDN